MTLSIDHRHLKTHLALTTCASLSDLMMPKLRPHGINAFHYYNIDKVGHVIRLSTYQQWTEHYFKKNYISTALTAPEEYYPNKTSYFIWLIQDCAEMLLDAAYHFNMANGISIVMKNEETIEFFGFSSTRYNTSIINFYINHLDLLENYCHYFKDQAKNLINDYKKDKIIPIKSIKQAALDELKRQSSLQLLSDHLLMRSIKLSNRQLICASLLLEGFSYKEIALRYHLSPRTIETYVNQLKDKLNTRNKTELILKLSELTQYGLFLGEKASKT